MPCPSGVNIPHIFRLYNNVGGTARMYQRSPISVYIPPVGSHNPIILGHHHCFGFRFLKDPLFYAESLYLKLPQRIMALLMVMTLSLLMYSLAEMRVRTALKEKQCSIWDQKNRKTDRPTVRWVFMIFEDVLLLYTKRGKEVEKQAMNIREEHRIILECLGPQFKKIYFL